ncbi:unnamed protein product [Caenorhabditis brenneri]
MDIVQTCQTIVIILDNLISLIVFIISVVHYYYSPPIIVRLDKTFRAMLKKVRAVRKQTKRLLLVSDVNKDVLKVSLKFKCNSCAFWNSIKLIRCFLII